MSTFASLSWNSTFWLCSSLEFAPVNRVQKWLAIKNSFTFVRLLLTKDNRTVVLLTTWSTHWTMLQPLFTPTISTELQSQLIQRSTCTTSCAGCTAFLPTLTSTIMRSSRSSSQRCTSAPGSPTSPPGSKWCPQISTRYLQKLFRSEMLTCEQFVMRNLEVWAHEWKHLFSWYYSTKDWQTYTDFTLTNHWTNHL